MKHLQLIEQTRAQALENLEYLNSRLVKQIEEDGESLLDEYVEIAQEKCNRYLVDLDGALIFGYTYQDIVDIFIDCFHCMKENGCVIYWKD